ncbi:hypothetical protein MPY17_20835 [Rhodococcus opacus]|uniref:hypothetical protein n=1 Tax=Rhodococcus opacus TaxID=37919 RepID=UPI001FF33D8B|nr:hypothetical protein [Rhodococcus opacus]UOT01454.1 hypothetical protein MPY17_20835 [Rhodococcus opacus]
MFAVRGGLGAQVGEVAPKTVHVLAGFLRGCLCCSGLRFGACLGALGLGGRLLRRVNLLSSRGLRLRDPEGGAAADLLDRGPCLLLGLTDPARRIGRTSSTAGMDM